MVRGRGDESIGRFGRSKPVKVNTAKFTSRTAPFLKPPAFTVQLAHARTVRIIKTRVTRDIIMVKVQQLWRKCFVTPKIERKKQFLKIESKPRARDSTWLAFRWAGDFQITLLRVILERIGRDIKHTRLLKKSKECNRVGGPNLNPNNLAIECILRAALRPKFLLRLHMAVKGRGVLLILWWRVAPCCSDVSIQWDDDLLTMLATSSEIRENHQQKSWILFRLAWKNLEPGDHTHTCSCMCKFLLSLVLVVRTISLGFFS